MFIQISTRFSRTESGIVLKNKTAKKFPVSGTAHVTHQERLAIAKPSHGTGLLTGSSDARATGGSPGLMIPAPTIRARFNSRIKATFSAAHRHRAKCRS